MSTASWVTVPDRGGELGLSLVVQAAPAAPRRTGADRRPGEWLAAASRWLTRHPRPTSSSGPPPLVSARQDMPRSRFSLAHRGLTRSSRAPMKLTDTARFGTIRRPTNGIARPSSPTSCYRAVPTRDDSRAANKKCYDQPRRRRDATNRAQSGESLSLGHIRRNRLPSAAIRVHCDAIPTLARTLSLQWRSTWRRQGGSAGVRCRWLGGERTMVASITVAIAAMVVAVGSRHFVLVCLNLLTALCGGQVERSSATVGLQRVGQHAGALSRCAVPLGNPCGDGAK
jgi:hypothetical protein